MGTLHKSCLIRKAMVFATALVLSLALPCSADAPAASQAATTQSGRTALDEYVAAPDPNYRYQVLNVHKGRTHVTYVIEMTSQAWRTAKEVDRPTWKHWLIVVRPIQVSTSKSLLVIGGGGNGGNAPRDAGPLLSGIALATQSVVAELRMVPNQPLVFAGDGRGRKEDAFIAYTWDKFLRSGDKTWPARLPMTKAVVRAMDTVMDFCKSPAGGNVKVDAFVVTGASKRGWTTWSTAAVDSRVVAIMPIVIDLLNIERSMSHHYGAYGFWAPAIGDYTALGIMAWMGTAENRALMQIEDPYEYRRRLTMPKFIINASGDQFFLPDSSRFYFSDLPGVKYLRYIPNTDHSLKGSDAYETLLACYQAVLKETTLPKFSWTLEEDGSIKVAAKDKPSAVKLWQATNPGARDFRLCTIGKAYKGSELADQGEGVYVAKVAKPNKGWTAFFVELTFPSGGGAPFKFTTEVRVLPDTLPHKFVPKGKPK